MLSAGELSFAKECIDAYLNLRVLFEEQLYCVIVFGFTTRPLKHPR